jgi:hypothetical protein
MAFGISPFPWSPLYSGGADPVFPGQPHGEGITVVTDPLTGYPIALEVELPNGQTIRLPIGDNIAPRTPVPDPGNRIIAGPGSPGEPLVDIGFLPDTPPVTGPAIETQPTPTGPQPRPTPGPSAPLGGLGGFLGGVGQTVLVIGSLLSDAADINNCTQIQEDAVNAAKQNGDSARSTIAGLEGILASMRQLQSGCVMTPACAAQLKDAMSRISSAISQVEVWLAQNQSMMRAVLNVDCSTSPSSLTGSGEVRPPTVQMPDQIQQLTSDLNGAVATWGDWAIWFQNFKKQCQCAKVTQWYIAGRTGYRNVNPITLNP